MIIVLSGVFAALWTWLGERQPSTPTTFALGTGIMGVAFLLFLPFTGPAGTAAPCSSSPASCSSSRSLSCCS
jgi:POT family proton-dependent oligopeptide transporter